MRLALALALASFVPTAHATSRDDRSERPTLHAEARVVVAGQQSHESHTGRARLAPREVAFFAACTDDRLRAEVRVEPSRPGHAWVHLLLHDAPACGEGVVRATSREVRFSDAPFELTLTRGDERATAWVSVSHHDS